MYLKLLLTIVYGPNYSYQLEGLVFQLSSNHVESHKSVNDVIK